MSLFDGVISQQIDENGKTRVVNYKIKGEHISLCVNPIPPLDVEIVDELYRVERGLALRFMEKKGIEPTENIIGGISGSFQDLYICYIPTKPNEDIVPKGILPPVLDTSKPSKLTLMRKNSKIAEFLKKYALYTFSIHFDKFGNEPNDKQISKLFVVKPNHVYQIENLNKKLFVEGNDVMYDDNEKMIVSSNEMLLKLVSYIQVNIQNNYENLKNMKYQKIVDTYYQGLVDFRQTKEEIIFTSKLSLLRWKDSLKYQNNFNYIFPRIIPFIKQPYFYNNYKIFNNKIMLVQNVEDGDIKRAITVSHIWNKERINKGFSCPIIKDVAIPYLVWYNEGQKTKVEGDNNYEEASIYEYSKNNYSALLFI